jgi:hypothetical protein
MPLKAIGTRLSMQNMAEFNEQVVGHPPVFSFLAKAAPPSLSALDR